MEAGNVATVGGLVAAGLGVTALPALVKALMSFASLTHRPLVEPVVERRLDIVTVADRPVSPATRHVLGLLGELRGMEHELPAGVSWAPVERPRDGLSTEPGF